MTGGDERGYQAGLVGWARAACVRAAARAVAAAESAAALGEQADRKMARMAERNPEYAERMQAIIVTAARQRAAIAASKRGWAAGRPDGQLLPRPRNEPGAAGGLQDQVIQGMFTAGLTLQDAADLTTEPEVRWRIQAAADDLDELIRAIRGALFDPAG